MTTAPGARAVCAQCGAPIVYVGPYWSHEGEPQPRHPAFPDWPPAPPAPQAAQAPAIRASIALLRPSLSGEDLTPIEHPRVFTAADWGLIVREVNDWLRVEVAPYWEPGQLRMDVVIPSTPTAPALRAALYGLAVAWGLQWQ